MSEPTQIELFDAIKDSLQKQGHLDKFKAELRFAVMGILNKNVNEGDTPKCPDETRFINELIREFLIWNGYVYSDQILSAESGQPNERVDREVLATKLGVIDDSKTSKIPLLYYIVSAFQNNDNDE